VQVDGKKKDMKRLINAISDLNGVNFRGRYI